MMEDGWEQCSSELLLSTAPPQGSNQDDSDSSHDSSTQCRGIVATIPVAPAPGTPQKLFLRGGGVASTRKHTRRKATPGGRRSSGLVNAAAGTEAGAGGFAMASGAGAGSSTAPSSGSGAGAGSSTAPSSGGGTGGGTSTAPSSGGGTGGGSSTAQPSGGGAGGASGSGTGGGTGTGGGAPTTPNKRPSTSGTGQSTTKKRISPKKSSSLIIPGTQLPNSGRHALPKGTMMEMLQVRDLEIVRLMEEMQDYENEATVLTHQIHVLTNEKKELRMQLQEMSRDMANIQYSANNMKLQKDSGPKLTFWTDNNIATVWDRLFDKVMTFCDDLCHWNEEGDVDYMGKYRPEASAKTPGGPLGYWGTFEAMLDEKNETEVARLGISQRYLRELASDAAGKVYPGRLDAFIGEDKANELLPAAMIMKILQREVFDKIRWLIRSEPFWDPVQSYSSSKSGRRMESSPDFLVQQEHDSASNDASAYEFNCIRAKMILHLTDQQGGFSTALINYLSRVGVVILHAIHPFLTVGCIDSDKLGEHKAPNSHDLYTFQDYIIEHPDRPKEDTEKQLQNILTAAMQLALIMRTDNSVTYLDSGGWNTPWNPTMMENVAPLTIPYKSGNDVVKRYMDETYETFVWLVVAPCIKRAGYEDGTGYNQARVISRSKVALRYGADPKKLIEGSPGWTY